MNDKAKAVACRLRVKAADVGAAAQEVIREAGRKTGDTVEITRLNVRIFDVGSEMNVLYRKLGELMYAAYINYNYDTKMKYYKWATENHSAEWGAWNNAGAIAFYLGDYPEAERYLKVARDMNPHNPDILNNTGLLCLAQNDYTLAKYYFEEAKRQGSSDADANIIILNLKRGNYEEAQKLMKGTSCSYNLAFAQLENDQVDACIRTLNCCLDQTAEVNYLRAIAYARLGDRENCLKNLQASVDQEYEYKRKAAVDVEFKNYWNDEDFKLVIKLY